MMNEAPTEEDISKLPIDQQLEFMKCKLEEINNQRKADFARFSKSGCRLCYGRGWLMVRPPNGKFSKVEPCSCSRKGYFKEQEVLAEWKKGVAKRETSVHVNPSQTKKGA